MFAGRLAMSAVAGEQHSEPRLMTRLNRELQFYLWLVLAALVAGPIFARMLQHGCQHWSEVLADGVVYSVMLGLAISSVPFGVQLFLAHYYRQSMGDPCGWLVRWSFIFASGLVALTGLAGVILIVFAIDETSKQQLNYPGGFGRWAAYSLVPAFVYCLLVNLCWVMTVREPQAGPQLRATPQPAQPPPE